jgi:pyrroloquinoline-quinone synthase
MRAREIEDVISSAVEERWLLRHPFYRRWEAGALTREELRDYAGQYRHVEAALPEILATIVASLPEGTARVLTAANLSEEQGAPVPHVELFERFAAAAEARAAVPPGPAATALLDLQRRAARSGAVGALSVLAVYELQAPDIAASKAGGLRTHYGFDDVATEFWDVHAVLETEHARWLTEALASLDPSPCDITRPAAESAAAWWAFLDEREAAAPRAAA